MNEQPPGARSGDDEGTDPAATRGGDGETTPDESVTEGNAVGDRGSGERAGASAGEGTPSMSMPAGRPAGATGGATASAKAPHSPGARPGRTAVMVILALIVGALVGGGVVAVTRSHDGASTTGAGSTGSATTGSSEPTPSALLTSPSTTATLPPVCLNLTAEAQAIVDLTTQAAEATRDLKAAKLSSIVKKLDTAQQLLRADTAACRVALNNGS